MGRRSTDVWARKTKATNKTINDFCKIGKSMAKAYKAYQREEKRQQREHARQVAAYNRLVAKNERERVRQIKQHEIALRRAEREREKAERELEREARKQAKLQEQQRVEDEMAQIKDDNYLWTNIHSFIDHIATIDDVKETIAKCEYEQQNDVQDGFFETKRPTDSSAKQKAISEAERKYDIDSAQKDYEEAEKEWKKLSFDDVEPTIESVSDELVEEAKETISAFFPWKQSKLRKAYVAEHFEERFKEKHDAWESKRKAFESFQKELLDKTEEKRKIVNNLRKSKNNYISKRATELYDAELKAWEEEKVDFYETFLMSMQNVIDGDKDYVITAISSLFPDEELPMEYFVDFVYEEEKGKVMVDLDLPEIEDIPEKKIVLTQSGKKSIRMKGQTDLRFDYAHCVFGLAMYVAYSIFNVSLKIQEIEISGFTQRKDSNSAVATDQYIFLVSFTRDLFSKIDYTRLSPIQIMDFFRHCFNMTKSYDLKQIDLSKAYDKMEAFTVANYDDFILNLPPEDKERPAISTNNGGTSKGVEDSPRETYDKSDQFFSVIYNYLDRLSKDIGVNKHTDNLKNVKISFTTGGFTGDADPNTYRGKIFFCALVDLYRCLQLMKINTNLFTPSVYPFAIYALNIYGKLDIEYYMLGKCEDAYHSFCDMMKVANKIPKQGHVFLVAEMLFDYDNDLSWYHDYLDIIGKYIGIVRSSVLGSSIGRQYIDDFIKDLNNKGIDIKLS